MIVDAVLAAVIIACLIGMVIVIIRKFPVLASIDLQATTVQAEVRKTTLLEQRLKRKFTSAFQSVKTAGTPAVGILARFGQTAQKKLVDLEHEYKVRALPVLMNRFQRTKVAAEVGELCDQAKALYADGETEAAEEKALQAIRLDPRSVDAFNLLGELYTATKEFGQAKEVYLYLVKLATDPRVHAEPGDPVHTAAQDNLSRYQLEVAEACAQLEQWDEAFQYITQAVELEPENPKILDEYIEVAIGAQQKLEAQEAVDRLKSVNPDNGKISSWEERISAIDPLHHHSPSTI